MNVPPKTKALLLPPGEYQQTFSTLNFGWQRKTCVHAWGWQPLHIPTAGIETTSPSATIPSNYWKRQVIALQCESLISLGPCKTPDFSFESQAEEVWEPLGETVLNMLHHQQLWQHKNTTIYYIPQWNVSIIWSYERIHPTKACYRVINYIIWQINHFAISFRQTSVLNMLVKTH